MKRFLSRIAAPFLAAAMVFTMAVFAAPAQGLFSRAILCSDGDLPFIFQNLKSIPNQIACNEENAQKVKLLPLF